ncbi:RDD family protein [Pseudonocardia abyssalis]|uniref:RDD family protein n=1 Tax=Pseudonocardia abyssalis TaxID=2792008 RepID=A0ABS6UW88_9PSEU|nr:RDD family protein [Pseudonocardia abyssalis]MBW0118067.1 RDD family protein [Pseudonocardia abyssalis]MBW0136512.1 RDD family protein [Pseudonocardia abyssalis]
MPTTHLAPAPVGRRVRASLDDLLFVAAWFALLTLLGVAVRAIAPPAGPPSLPATDLTVLASTVLPVAAFLAAGDAGVRWAARGKRRAGLRVVTPDGARPSVGRSVVRAAVKIAPWQLAHIAVARLILGADDPVVTWTTYALSLAVPVVSVVTALRDPRQRALHDRVAGTRVVTF